MSVAKPVEFSEFYNLLNRVKEGNSNLEQELNAMVEEYKNNETAESELHELGQVFIYVGLMELYKYTESEDINFIGCIDKEGWDALEEKNKAELPPHLANTMISYAKKNNLSKEIAKKWDKRTREINKHIMGMARYITEGIIDVID